MGPCETRTCFGQATRGFDADSAVSRAYYAAFHAVNALFSLRGQSFTKHYALRGALLSIFIHPAMFWDSALTRTPLCVLGSTASLSAAGSGPRNWVIVSIF